MNYDFDIIIIGAGFAGASTAYHLSKFPGLKILLLEREESYGQHASGRNAAMLRQALVATPLVSSWIQETLSVLKNPPRDWETPVSFRQNGSILLGTEIQVQHLMRSLHSVEAKGEVFRRGQFPQDFFPTLKQFLHQADYEAMLWTPEDGVVDIHALLTNYLQAARRRGVTFKTSAEVLRIHRAGEGWFLQLRDQQYSALVVVNAAGAWVNALAKSAGLALLGLAPLRRHLYISETLAWVEPDWPFVWDMQHEFYFRPESGGLLFSPGDEESHPPQEPITDPHQAEVLAEKLQRYFPPLSQLAMARGWACLRTKIPDGDFFVDWDGHSEGFFWVAALGGHGMGSSFGVGKTAADKILHFFVGREKIDANKRVTL